MGSGMELRSEGTMKLKIAYLILAHHAPKHFGRLLRALNSPNATFFIHVDKKESIEPFLHAAEEDQLQSEVIFIKSRVEVYWGEGSVVDATLNLVMEALKNCPEADYFCLLSGDSYPLQPPDYIEKFLLKNKGTEFITMSDHSRFRHRMNLQPVPSKYKNKMVVSFLIRALNRARINLVKACNYCIGRDDHSVVKDLELYGGSLWWTLSNSACCQIINFAKQNPNVVSFFKTRHIPDEMIYQTIIGNSPFKNRTRPHIVARRGTMTFDKINCIRNKTITSVTHVTGNKNREILLARKFSDDSKPLTDLIDKLWLNKVEK